MEKDKIIKRVDEETWREFAGRCKADGVIMGHKLTDILKEYLKN